MKFTPLPLPGAFLIEPKRHGDARGYFCETFRQDLFEAAIGPVRFVQDNHALSANAGTLRGLHFQKPPRAQGKLVRVTHGAVADAIVDIRHGSPAYGQHLIVELSAENGRQLWVPPGFLHGYCTLQDATELIYKVTDTYAPEADAAVRFNDPDIGIAWPFEASALILSDKDRRAPYLADLPPLFTFGEAP